MTRKAIIAGKVSVAAALVYAILHSINLEAFVSTLFTVRPLFCVIVCLLYPIGLFLSAVKLKWLLQGYRLPLGLRDSFDLNWMAGFLNNFLPSSIGGDAYRIIYMNRRYPESLAQVVSAVLLDRGLGLLTMLVFATCASVFFAGAVLKDVRLLGTLYLLAALAILIALFVLFRGIRYRPPQQSKRGWANKLHTGLSVLLYYPDKKLMASSLIVSFIFTGLVVLSNYCLFLAFDPRVPLALLFFVVPIINLSGMIPISINALGVTEGVGLFLLSLFGYQPEIVLSVLLLGRVLLVLSSATGGVPFVLRRDSMIVTRATQ